MQEVAIGLGNADLNPDQISDLEIELMMPGYVEEFSATAAGDLFGDPLNLQCLSIAHKRRATNTIAAANTLSNNLEQRYAGDGFDHGKDHTLCAFILALKELNIIKNLEETPEFHIDEGFGALIPTGRIVQAENQSFVELVEKILTHRQKMMQGPFSDQDIIRSYSKGFRYGESFAVALLNLRNQELLLRKDIEKISEAAGSLS